MLWDAEAGNTDCDENTHSKLACNMDPNAKYIKYFNKGLKKRREKPTLETAIFKYILLDPDQQQQQHQQNNGVTKNAEEIMVTNDDGRHSENGVMASDEDEGLFKIIPNENSSEGEWNEDHVQAAPEK